MNPSSIWFRRAEVGMFAERQYLQFITVINVTDQILAERAMQSDSDSSSAISRFFFHPATSLSICRSRALSLDHEG